jgi:hypothetical protein
MTGVPVEAVLRGVMLTLTVLVGVALLLLLTVLQAPSAGRRKSNTRRLVPTTRRFGEDKAAFIMMYPLSV